MSQFPVLPIFTDAFLADTGHLNAQETGAYFLLIMIAWRSPDCRLPDDDAKLARWARLDMRTWRRLKNAIMGEFWTLNDGFWTQKRLSKEREIVSKRAEVARDNGKLGGRPKSLENNETGNPVGSPSLTQKKAPISISTYKNKEDSSSLRSEPREERNPEPNRKTTKRTACRPDFWPNDNGQRRAADLGIDISEEVRRFVDYHTGKGSLMADWQAAWRTWCDSPYRKPPGQPARGPTHRRGPSFAELAEQADSELRARKQRHEPSSAEPEIIEPTDHGQPRNGKSDWSLFERPGGNTGPVETSANRPYLRAVSW